MLIPPEQKQYFLSRRDALMRDDSADPEEKQILEAAVAVIRMEEAVALNEDDFNDLGALGDAIEGLLKIVFGSDVDITNIRERFEKLSEDIDKKLQIVEMQELSAKSNKKNVVWLHLALSQRILMTAVGFYIHHLEIHWTWLEKDAERSTMVINILQKLIAHLKLLPVYILLRKVQTLTPISKSINVSYQQLAIDKECGTATLQVDLLQPKEVILKAFEDFIDESKNEMRGIPGNQGVVNLYDVRRKKDGRLDKSIYMDWHDAIKSMERACDFNNFYEASKMAPNKIAPKEDPENVRKRLEFRAKRYHTLLQSILNDRFPSLD